MTMDISLVEINKYINKNNIIIALPIGKAKNIQLKIIIKK
jgi:hypothetical protein